MNDIGFINADITACCSIAPITDNIDIWDHQTVVLLCDNNNIDNIMRLIRSRRRPNSISSGFGYYIHGFVNLNYDIYEVRPEYRNIRIVYCNMDIMSIEEVINRFSCSYIFNVEGSKHIEWANNDRKIPMASD